MDLDQTFRLILIAASLVLFSVGVYHRVRSRATRERLDRWQEGPFIWVRHPFYVAVALSMLANGLVAANWFLLLGGGLTVLLLVIRTRTEEEKLLARFGERYRQYMADTGRFLPRVNP
jgi:protein-S-isoprenylcysteine O-methyltransferase Ste14